MGVFAKKLDLNILKIDWATAILSSNFEFKKKYEIFLAEENYNNNNLFPIQYNNNTADRVEKSLVTW